jgi:hypothetical protein
MNFQHNFPLQIVMKVRYHGVKGRTTFQTPPHPFRGGGLESCSPAPKFRSESDPTVDVTNRGHLTWRDVTTPTNDKEGTDD